MTKQTTKETDLIYFDRKNFEADKRQLQKVEAALNDLLSEIHSLGEIEVTTIGELYNITKQAFDYGRESVVKLLQEKIEPPKVAGIPMKRKAAIEMMELPDLTNFFTAVDNVRIACRDSIGQIEKRFEITKQGNVKLLQTEINRLEAFYTIKPKSKKEREFFRALKDAANALNEAHQKGKEVNFPLFRYDRQPPEHNIEKAFNLESNEVAVNPELYYRMDGKM